MIRAFVSGLPLCFARVFAPRCLLWHAAAIILTYLSVASGFDWLYFTRTRFDNLVGLTLPAAILGFFVPIVVPILAYYWGEWRGSRKLMRTAVVVAQAEALGWIVSSLYKAFTGRLQPELLPSAMLDDISRQFNFGFWENGIFWGWPSSHTTVAFAGAAALICLYKSFALSVKGLSYSWDSLVREAEKCVLVCKNCHTEIEAGLVKVQV